MSAKIRLDDLVILYNLQNGECVTLLWCIQRCVCVFSCVDSVRMNRPNWNQLLIFFAEKVTYIIYRIIIPSLFMPWTRVVSAWNLDYNYNLSTMYMYMYPELCRFC